MIIEVNYGAARIALNPCFGNGRGGPVANELQEQVVLTVVLTIALTIARTIVSKEK
jgi:hypothetical protein